MNNTLVAFGGEVVETRPKIVVIVDDDITNLTIGRSALSDRFNVFTSPSGEKLFYLLGKIKPDIILLDIEMPGMNGYEVIKKLKSSEETSHIPVIFLTGKAESEIAAEYLKHGAVAYSTKPFSRDRLSELIYEHANSDPGAKPAN